MKIFLGLMLMLINFSVFAGYDIVQVKEEKRDGKELVQEIFYYACQHCNEIEDDVLSWKKTISKNTIFEKVPVAASPKQKMAAKHFYASIFLNIEEQFSKKYFKEISSGNKISDNLAKKIMIQLGEKEGKISSAFESHWVSKKIKEAEALTLKLKVSSVPLFLVNSKYILKRSGYENDTTLFKEIKKLIK